MERSAALSFLEVVNTVKVLGHNLVTNNTTTASMPRVVEFNTVLVNSLVRTGLNTFFEVAIVTNA